MQKQWIINIFYNLQNIINNLKKYNSDTSWILQMQIYYKSQKLIKQSFYIIFI